MYFQEESLNYYFLKKLTRKTYLYAIVVFGLLLSFSSAPAANLAIIVSNNNQGELESCG